ncbi:MAG: Stk1 family PASTA domain-containing Ser/Thr kinase [Aeromicrobium sp.]|uniref:Stk1 family PASTA domain-containing Ser/Thr kinase n=1 Tax=Aeromicrobium sp. TaxID=1871063 RepID=UPI0039E4ADB6
MTEPHSAALLGGRYQLGQILGRGGMADVRIGQDLRLGRTVAVKQLRADLASDPTFQERFRREAQSAASLNHPSIVAVYDTGEAPNEMGVSIPYIVMEYVEGQTLREVLRNDRKILPERALSITGDILNALDYSHRSGIVHRDIKPANVMLTPTGQVKVMDFGIARAIADASSAMTQTAAVIGTAQYLSPEQARGETVDARSDIYSTGCVLYELLAGRPPFQGDSPVSVAYQHVREQALPPSQFNPEVSQTIDHIVAKSLAKRVEDRYQSAGDMRRDIERAIVGQPVDAPTALAGATSATQVVPSVTEPAKPGARRALPEEDEEEASKRKWWIIGVIALILLIVAGFAIWKLTEPDEDPAKQVTVPSSERIVGQTVEVATTVLQDAGLEVATETVSVTSTAEQAGLVMDTDPAPGTKVDEGTEVTLKVGAGPEQEEIPNVIDLSFSDAESELTSLGFVVERIDQDNAAPKDTVFQVTPTEGRSVAKGSTVKVYVSKGQVDIPTGLVGKTADEVKSILQEQGFTGSIPTQTDYSDEYAKDMVMAIDPSEGSRISPDSTITLTISLGPKPEETTATPTP